MCDCSTGPKPLWSSPPASQKALVPAILSSPTLTSPKGKNPSSPPIPGSSQPLRLPLIPLRAPPLPLGTPPPLSPTLALPPSPWGRRLLRGREGAWGLGKARGMGTQGCGEWRAGSGQWEGSGVLVREGRGWQAPWDSTNPWLPAFWANYPAPQSRQAGQAKSQLGFYPCPWLPAP